MVTRTYNLQEDTIRWIDRFADEANTSKSKVVNRAIRVYAAKTASGDWNDPRFRDVVDQQFRKTIGGGDKRK